MKRLICLLVTFIYTYTLWKRMIHPFIHPSIDSSSSYKDCVCVCSLFALQWMYSSYLLLILSAKTNGTNKNVEWKMCCCFIIQWRWEQILFYSSIEKSTIKTGPYLYGAILFQLVIYFGNFISKKMICF